MFKSVVVDVDSTLSSIEGIDWLAARRSEEIRRWVVETTARAMRGEIPVADVYGQRLDAVRPTRNEIVALSRAYVENVEPPARDSIGVLRHHEIRVILLTAGLRDAILPLAEAVGVAAEDVYGVSVYFDELANYAGFDRDSPLTRNGGKAEMVRRLGLPRPIVGVGDGITDAEMKLVEPPAIDAFIAYTGFVERPAVVKAADHVIRSFAELPPLILG